MNIVSRSGFTVQEVFRFAGGVAGGRLFASASLAFLAFIVPGYAQPSARTVLTASGPPATSVPEEAPGLTSSIWHSMVATPLPWLVGAAVLGVAAILLVVATVRSSGLEADDRVRRLVGHAAQADDPTGSSHPASRGMARSARLAQLVDPELGHAVDPADRDDMSDPSGNDAPDRSESSDAASRRGRRAPSPAARVWDLSVPTGAVPLTPGQVDNLKNSMSTQGEPRRPSAPGSGQSSQPGRPSPKGAAPVLPAPGAPVRSTQGATSEPSPTVDWTANPTSDRLAELVADIASARGPQPEVGGSPNAPSSDRPLADDRAPGAAPRRPPSPSIPDTGKTGRFMQSLSFDMQTRLQQALGGASPESPKPDAVRDNAPGDAPGNAPLPESLSAPPLRAVPGAAASSSGVEPTARPGARAGAKSPAPYQIPQTGKTGRFIASVGSDLQSRLADVLGHSEIPADDEEVDPYAQAQDATSRAPRPGEAPVSQSPKTAPSSAQGDVVDRERGTPRSRRNLETVTDDAQEMISRALSRPPDETGKTDRFYQTVASDVQARMEKAMAGQQEEVDERPRPPEPGGRGLLRARSPQSAEAGNAPGLLNPNREKRPTVFSSNPSDRTIAVDFSNDLARAGRGEELNREDEPMRSPSDVPRPPAHDR